MEEWLTDRDVEVARALTLLHLADDALVGGVQVAMRLVGVPAEASRGKADCLACVVWG